jgi:rhodanese-related sulfurtransferase
VLPHQIRTVDVSEIPTHAVLLDVREDEEWDAGHIDGAWHVPMYQVPQHVNHAEDLNPETPIVVICKMGGRSAQVTAWLSQQGYDAVNLDGGMHAWADAGRPIVSEDGQPARIA